MTQAQAKVHWAVGTLTLAVFLLSGAYMKWFRVPPVHELDDVTRALYRSRHLFLLLAAVVNLAIVGVPLLVGWRKTIATVVLVTAPALLAIAFVVEPAGGLHAGMWSAAALYMLFALAAMLVLAARPRRD